MKASKKYLVITAIFCAQQNALAASFDDFLKQTDFSGDIRAYDFNRDFDKSGNPSQNSFSLGGSLNVLSGPIFLNELKVGASFYTAQPLGINSDNPHHVDPTLPGKNVNVLGQDFLQYQSKKYLVRGGNQTFDTPWLNSIDSRMIPATYEGVLARTTLFDGLNLSALRTFKFKSRTENGFDNTNLYNPGNPGDTPIPAFGSTTNNGALAVGAHFEKNNLTAQAWGYRFYDFSNLIYADTKYKFSSEKIITPYFGLQGLREWGDGNNLLKPYEGGSANANAIGMLIGTKLKQIDLSAAYNNIPINDHSFKKGDILSPYTSGYGDDPLYTTSMLGGLVEKTSGQAVKLNGLYTSPNDNWQFGGSVSKYFTNPRASNTKETDLDASYHFSGKLKGLSARNRIGLLNGNHALGRFVYNRLMLEYTF